MDIEKTVKFFSKKANAEFEVKVIKENLKTYILEIDGKLIKKSKKVCY